MVRPVSPGMEAGAYGIHPLRRLQRGPLGHDITSEDYIEYQFACSTQGKLHHVRWCTRPGCGWREETTETVERSNVSHDLTYVPKAPVEGEKDLFYGAHYRCSFCGLLFADPDGTELLTDSVTGEPLSEPRVVEDVIAESFGSPQTFGDHTFYVDDEGRTSIVLKDDGVSWLRESSDGASAWFGFDNSVGALPDGAVVSVNWYSKEDKAFNENFRKATEGIDASAMGFSDNVCLCELNAYKRTEDGLEKADRFGSGKKMKVYIELDEDWDIDDIKAMHLDGDHSSELSCSIEGRIIHGVPKRFGVVVLDHFSFYAVGEAKPVS